MTDNRYQDHLRLAVTCAREAGELLRHEFHRAGGPRGSHGHAPVDDEAQVLICKYLTEAFPEYGMRCEESSVRGRAPMDEETHCWVVDPNDGTSSFLKGRRGAAVSIALLRAGRPVLGVVFAYNAPDDQGDLFTWAEGLPLRRNDEVVERTWPEHLGETSTILLSASAGDSPTKNGRRVAPARFRGLPSIAYRLALVAAGEADLAVSTSCPVDWDYAGGHALLLGAGGDLFDSNGKPVTYTLDGRSHVGTLCIGGGAPLARELIDGRSRKTPKLEVVDGPTDSIVPKAGEAVADPGRLSRAQGCLLGQLCGDALGALVEFQSAETILRKYPEGVRDLLPGGPHGVIAGQPTDDSELALSLARALVRAGRWDAEAVATSYAWWIDSNPFDVGTTTGRPLRAARDALEKGEAAVPAARRVAKRRSTSNGALMRVSPLGIFGHRLNAGQLERLARADARLTHPHPDCQSADVLFTLAIAVAIDRGLPAAEVYTLVRKRAGQSDVSDRVKAAVEAAETAPPSDYTRDQGNVVVALQNALYQLLHAKAPAEGLIDTVRRGGDTDTNAAVAGALLGAVHGLRAWPVRWRDRVLSCRPMRGLEGVRQPRPRAFWPVDALELAERLLLLGEATAAEASRQGRRLSGPHGVDNLRLFLIHGLDQVDTSKLSLLHQVIADGTAVVRETEEVQRLLLDNNGDLPVLCLLGDIVKGGYQDRVLRSDMVVTPGTVGQSTPVHCVEQSRWHARGHEDSRSFSSSDRVAPSDLRRKISRGAGQSQVWAEVAQTQARLSRSRGRSVRDERSASSLQLTMEHQDVADQTARYEQAFERLADAADAVGHVAVINGRLHHAEWFGSAELHRRAWPRLLRAMAVEAAAQTGEDGQSAPDADEVTSWLDALLTSPEASIEPAGATHTRRRQSPAGSCVETLWTDDVVLHGVLSR